MFYGCGVAKYKKKDVDKREVRGAKTRARITRAVWQLMAMVLSTPATSCRDERIGDK